MDAAANDMEQYFNKNLDLVEKITITTTGGRKWRLKKSKSGNSVVIKLVNPGSYE